VRPYLEILKLVWPLALGMVNNAAMQFVDRAFLARASMECLEAILPASTLAWVIVCFFQAVVGYTGVFVAQYHGAGDAANGRRSYHAGLWIAAASGLAMLPLVPLGDLVFAWTAPSAVIAGMERAYYDIAILGGVFVFGQMAALSFFTGRGQTRVVFWVNLCGNLLNVALDPLLIFGCHFSLFTFHFTLSPLGISGAALATVVSLALQFAVLLGLAARGGKAEGSATVFDCSPSLVRWILRFGIPAGGFEVLGMFSFTAFVFVTGWLDGVSFAASNTCFTINYLLFAPMTGFALGAQTLVGQARGRGDDAGAGLALRRTMILALVFSAVACLVVLALNRPILGLFAPVDPAARAAFMDLGFRLLLLMSAWLLFDSADTVLAGALKGAGDTRFVFVWTALASLLVWLPLVCAAFACSRTMPTLWATTIAYVVVLLAGSWVRWRRGSWRRCRILRGCGPLS